jgi:hypothetical protein
MPWDNASRLFQLVNDAFQRQAQRADQVITSSGVFRFKMNLFQPSLLKSIQLPFRVSVHHFRPCQRPCAILPYPVDLLIDVPCHLKRMTSVGKSLSEDPAY